MAKHFRNIQLKKYKKFLLHIGCEHSRTKGSHLIYTCPDCTRSVVVQAHKSPVPPGIIRSNLETLGMSREEFFRILDEV